MNIIEFKSKPMKRKLYGKILLFLIALVIIFLCFPSITMANESRTTEVSLNQPDDIQVVTFRPFDGDYITPGMSIQKEIKITNNTDYKYTVTDYSINVLVKDGLRTQNTAAINYGGDVTDLTGEEWYQINKTYYEQKYGSLENIESLKEMFAGEILFTTHDSPEMDILMGQHLSQFYSHMSIVIPDNSDESPFETVFNYLPLNDFKNKTVSQSVKDAIFRDVVSGDTDYAFSLAFLGALGNNYMSTNFEFEFAFTLERDTSSDPRQITIKKVDSLDHAKTLPGVAFSLSKQDNDTYLSTTKTTDNSGKLNFELDVLHAGTYILHEENTIEDYQPLASDITLVIDENGEIINATPEQLATVDPVDKTTLVVKNTQTPTPTKPNEPVEPTKPIEPTAPTKTQTGDVDTKLRVYALCMALAIMAFMFLIIGNKKDEVKDT